MILGKLVQAIGCVLVLAWGALASPPPPYLVKNVNPGPASSEAYPLVDVNGTLFFSALRDEFGKELWKSDGTKHGTVMVKDIYPGIASVQEGIPYGNSSLPDNLTNVAGTLFFTADSPAYGEELWKSDGTEAGTVLVKDIVPGPDGSVPYDFVANGTRLFFTVNGQLWVSDGSAAGTVQLSGLGVGMPPYDGLYPRVVGTTTYFAYLNTSTGDHDELWKTDGTVGGTSLVKSFGSGIDIDLNYVAGTFGSLLLFNVCDATFTCQLWRSDGTLGGTFALTSLSAGGDVYSPPVAAGALAFFLAREDATGGELWKTDGTALGTSLVTELVAGADDASIDSLNLVSRGSELFFLISDILQAGMGGLWRSDGTSGGTYRVFAAQVDDQSYQNSLVNAGGTLLFRTMTPPADDLYLTRSDGTTLGTESVAEIRGHYFTYWFTVVGGALFYVPFAGDEYGAEPLIYLANCGDGTLGTGEHCDNGAMNGVDGICTTACILVADVDDDGVLNASDNCPSDWNPGQEDTDGDTEGDACEACVAGDVATNALLKVAKLDTPAADDRLTMKGVITIPTTPYVGPDIKGAIVRIEDSTRAVVLDVNIPGVYYDPLFLDGWKTNATYTSFTYLNKNPGGLQGIFKVTAKLDPDTGVVKFTIKGKDGSFAFDPMNLPLTGTFALDTEKPVIGQCGFVTFPNPPGTDGSCELNASGSSLRCK